MTPLYRVRRLDDGREITTVGLGMDARQIMAEAIAADFGLFADEIEFSEEYDHNGEWTGYDIAVAFGQPLARVELP